MKTFQLSDDRMLTAKKNLVTIKQKNSDKAFEFTPTRYLLCSIMFHNTTPHAILMSLVYITVFSLTVAVLLQMGRFPSDVRGNRCRSQGALRRRTSQVPGPYRWWTVRLRHQWLQMRRFQDLLSSIWTTGRQTHQEGHRSTSPRMGQHESYHRLRQRWLPHSGRGHPMLHADRPPGRGDSNLVSRVLPVSELNYARTNL